MKVGKKECVSIKVTNPVNRGSGLNGAPFFKWFHAYFFHAKPSFWARTLICGLWFERNRTSGRCRRGVCHHGYTAKTTRARPACTRAVAYAAST